MGNSLANLKFRNFYFKNSFSIIVLALLLALSLTLKREQDSLLLRRTYSLLLLLSDIRGYSDGVCVHSHFSRFRGLVKTFVFDVNLAL